MTIASKNENDFLNLNYLKTNSDKTCLLSNKQIFHLANITNSTNILEYIYKDHLKIEKFTEEGSNYTEIPLSESDYDSLSAFSFCNDINHRYVLKCNEDSSNFITGSGIRISILPLITSTKSTIYCRIPYIIFNYSFNSVNIDIKVEEIYQNYSTGEIDEELTKTIISSLKEQSRLSNYNIVAWPGYFALTNFTLGLAYPNNRNNSHLVGIRISIITTGDNEFEDEDGSITYQAFEIYRIGVFSNYIYSFRNEPFKHLSLFYPDEGSRKLITQRNIEFNGDETKIKNLSVENLTTPITANLIVQEI